MSLTVQAAQVTEISNKWELAQFISSQANTAEQALKALFTGAIQHLEGTAKTKFEASLIDRVWSAVSEEKLKTLKEAFILEFSETILDGFTEDEASSMLDEHKRIGAVHSRIYTDRLLTAFKLKRLFIFEALVNKTKSMTKEWLPEICNALKKEGIEFPDPTKS